MDLAVIFSERKEYTTDDPLKIRLDEGVHEIVGNDRGFMRVTCSHITFVGKGKNQTTILGGFHVANQQNVTFEELTLTNQANQAAGYGLLLMGSETNVDVLKCVVKECGSAGMWVQGGATVTATQCEFMENGGGGMGVVDGATVTATQCAFLENGTLTLTHGVYCRGANTKARLNDCQMHHNGNHGLRAYERAVVDLHGTKTAIHSNKHHGIGAGNRAKVNIHLPSQHNTSHDNVGEDRDQQTGGSIANINADGHSHT